VYLERAESLDRPMLANFHGAVFEIYVPYDFRATKNYLDAKEELRKLEAEVEKIKESISRTWRSKKPSSESKRAAEFDRLADKLLLLDQAMEAKHKARKQQQHELRANTREQERQCGDALFFGDKCQLRFVGK
jgi:hypothetical protein